LSGEKEMKLGKVLGYTAALLLLHGGLANSEEQKLGNFSFPNSGASEAQSAFLRGVGALHSFEFDEARIAFEKAQEIDPSFALAYWGQAMSDNHPLWRNRTWMRRRLRSISWRRIFKGG